MLNPFIQNPYSKEKKLPKAEQSLDAERPSSGQTQRPHGAALWVGNLLIKMGKKLTEEDHKLKGTQQNA